jgi:hypothetical protein
MMQEILNIPIITLMCTLTAYLPKLGVMAYGHNGLLSDECMVHLSAQYQNAYVWTKQNPHFFEEEAQL